MADFIPSRFGPDVDPATVLDINWALLAQLYAQYGRVLTQYRAYGRGILLEIEADDPGVPETFYARLKVGNPPNRISRYTRKDKFTKRGVERIVWRWRIGRQLEVYWCLTNLARFLRGPKRRKVEEKIHYLEEHLLVQNQLQRLGRVAQSPTIHLNKSQQRSGFLTRTHL